MTFVALPYGIILHISSRISPDVPFVPFQTIATNIKWLLKKSSSGCLKFSTEECSDVTAGYGILTDGTGGALLDIFAKHAGEFDIAHRSNYTWFAILVLVQTYGA